MMILKFFPKDPFLLPDEDTCAEAAQAASDMFPGCAVEWASSPLPQFVDCGDSLESVKCPVCGADIDSDDWSCAMDGLYTDDGFQSLDMTAPCCGAQTSLDMLEYIAPCGFSCFEIDVIDPGKLPKKAAEELSRRTGLALAMVEAHI